MSGLDDCIGRAIAAGKVDRDRGRGAQETYRDLVQRYVDSGTPRQAAEVMAADDVMESITSAVQRRRHTTLAQLKDAAAAQAEFSGSAASDPDRILRTLDTVEKKQRYYEQSFMSGISAFLRQHSTDVLGRVREKARLGNIARELHGENTGDASAKLMAQAIGQQMERARALFNALGGDIGKLDGWGLPHSHNAAKMRQAGFDGWWREIWDNNRLDWSRIRNFETGKPFAPTAGARPFEADARRFLREVYDGITTGGWDTRTPSGQTGGKALYNRGKEHRVLHFRDADAWMAYNEAFGETNVFDTVVRHLRAQARDIALMEQLGPNPKAGLELRAQILTKEVAGPAGSARVRDMGFLPRDLRAQIDRKTKKARVMLRHLTGDAGVPHDEQIARWFGGVRNLLTAAQLGGATISQVTDLATMRLAAKAAGLNPRSPFLQASRIMTRGMGADEARAYGYIFDTLFDTNAAHARLMGDVYSPETTQRITNFVMRANGMAYLTDRARTSMRLSFAHELGEQAGKRFDQLDPRLRNFLANRDLTPAEWDQLRDPAVMFTTPTGAKAITPTWFAEHSSLPRLEAERLGAKLGAIVEDFAELGVPTASTRGRASILGDTRAGTFSGELLRSGVMYKSYGLSLMFTHLRRGMEMNSNWSRAGYFMALTGTTMALGAVAVQLKAIARGEDPRPMDQTGFWGAAFFQGAGVGIFGDFFTSTTSRAGGRLAETAAGPVVGVVGDVLRAVNSNVVRVAEGGNAHIGRDAVNLGRRYNPLASYWPTRVALDRMLWDQLQMILDPEAERAFQEQAGRLRRDFGTEHWWRKGEAMPRRGPDLSNAMGGVR